MDYLKIDELVPASVSNQIEAALLYSDDVKWGWRDVTSGVEEAFDTNDKNIKETFQMQHDVFAYDRGIVNGELFQLLLTPMYFLEHYLKRTIKAPQRIKANMLIRDPDQKGFYHPPHIDLANDKEAFSMVYYVNDSDGDTVLFDKSFNPLLSSKTQHEGLKPLYNSTPKKGGCVVFRSNRYHASSNPVVADRRVIVNYVFLAENNFLTKIVDL